MARKTAYFDYNATTPLDKRVLDKMMPYLTREYGNAASSTHSYGWIAADAVKLAREQVATAMGASPQEIVFTSGATEAINLALKGVAEMYARKGNHIVTVATEHKAVLDVCKRLSQLGKEVTYLKVNQAGIIDLNELEQAIREDTLMVCVMLANNETGVIQPIRAIADIVHSKGAIMMSDAVQAFGKIPVKVDELGIDLMAVSAHKLYGPKGVGALYIRRRNPRVRIMPQIEGGGHERGRRSGTLNVPAIVGFGEAIRIASQEMAEERIRLKKLRDQLAEGLSTLSHIHINGHLTQRLSHVLNIAFEGVDSEGLIMAMRRIAVATGSACTSATMSPSHVLLAMGLSAELAYSSIRFSLGRFTTEEEVALAIQEVRAGVTRLRKQNI